MSKTLAFALLLFACGSSDNTKMDASMIDSPQGSGTALTVKNYLQWCSVTVNGGTASTNAMQVVSVNPGTIPLIAKAASTTFEVAGNMWHHTDGDTGGTGETGTVTGTDTAAMSTANVTVSTTAKCVWVCCPFSNRTGCDGVADQCP